MAIHYSTQAILALCHLGNPSCMGSLFCISLVTLGNIMNMNYRNVGD